MTLEEIKKQYAQENGFISWVEYIQNKNSEEVSFAMSEITKRYAASKLAEAAEINNEEIDKLAKEYAENENSCYSNDYYGYAYGYRKAKESIRLMKTAEERKLVLANVLLKHGCESSKEEILEDLGATGEGIEPWALVALEAMKEYANAKAKALLEEAAEKIEKELSEKANEASHYDSPSAKGFKNGLYSAASTIEKHLSLIPK